MRQTHTTLPLEIRIQSAELLNKHLAAAIDLRGQVKHARWNVRETHYIALHELLEKVSERVHQYSDMLAERAGALGGNAEGTIQVACERPYLIRYPREVATENKHVSAVCAALAGFSECLRTAVNSAMRAGDADTAELLTEIAGDVDDQLWLVGSHASPR